MMHPSQMRNEMIRIERRSDMNARVNNSVVSMWCCRMRISRAVNMAGAFECASERPDTERC